MGKLRLSRRGPPPAPVTPPALSLGGTPSTNAVVGTAYSFTPVPAGGSPPYSFTKTGDDITGFTFNTSTGTFSGTPGSSGTAHNEIITVHDAVGASVSLVSFDIVIADAPSGVYGNVGSVRPPGAIDANTTNWWNTINAAAAGAVIWLAVGDYGDMEMYNIQKAAPGVLIVGQTGVTANHIKLTSCAGLTFSYIDILKGTDSGSTNQDGSPRWNFGFLDQGGDRIGCVHCTFPNPGLVTVSPDPDGITGSYNGAGASFNSTTNATCTDNLVSHRATGISWYNVRGGSTSNRNTLARNKISHFNVDAIIVNGADFFLIDQNYIESLDNPLPAGDHPDSCQMGATSTARWHDGIISNNRVEALSGREDMQGITLCEHGDILLVNGNCCFGVQVNGLNIGDTTQVTINDNYWNAWLETTRVIIHDGNDQTVVTNNVAPAFDNAPGPNTNLTMPMAPAANGNTIIAKATSGSDTATRDTFIAAHPLLAHA